MYPEYTYAMGEHACMFTVACGKQGRSVAVWAQAPANLPCLPHAGGFSTQPAGILPSLPNPFSAPCATNVGSNSALDRRGGPHSGTHAALHAYLLRHFKACSRHAQASLKPAASTPGLRQAAAAHRPPWSCGGSGLRGRAAAPLSVGRAACEPRSASYCKRRRVPGMHMHGSARTPL